MFNADLKDPQSVLDAILEGSGAEIVIVNAQSRVVAASDGLAERLGVPPSLLQPGAPAPDLATLTGGRIQVETIAARGQRLIYLVRRSPTAPEGEQHERRELRAALDALDASVEMYDSDLRFLLANQAFHGFFPELPGEAALRGRPFSDIVGLMLEHDCLPVPVSRDQRAAYIARQVSALREGETSREFFDRRHRRWYLLHLVRAPGGQAVAVRIDIDDQKSLQKELLWNREAAQAALQCLRDDTLATLAAAQDALHRLETALARRDALPTEALATLRERLSALADRAGGRLSPASPAPPRR